LTIRTYDSKVLAYDDDVIEGERREVPPFRR
jgi:hypothetical protein